MNPCQLLLLCKCSLQAAHLGDHALHDEEVGVVDVELHGVEQVLHAPA